MDVIDVRSLDWSSLKLLYDKNLALLQDKLLSGATWEETGYLRDLVTRLETAMDKTLQPSSKVTEHSPSSRPAEP
ncbi:hypothetical protein [Flavisolibacter tropicus]|uniref:Uncharacterized protein n=1 Tax=Flavisolibacter tropicus TaxID=1492898 RepID=A0A172TUN4_9BACT|nr:hypothetical protein [Flavisolibacter tropicus]ANE50831.1 hypothetical protein SY85_10250 [Flavisolibacter tropicus]